MRSDGLKKKPRTILWKKKKEQKKEKNEDKEHKNGRRRGKR